MSHTNSPSSGRVEVFISQWYMRNHLWWIVGLGDATSISHRTHLGRGPHISRRSHFRSLLTCRLGFNTPTHSFSFFFFFFFSNFLQEQSFAKGVFKIRRRLIYTYENWLDIISTTKRCLFYEPWKFKSSLVIFSHCQQLVWWAPPIRCRLAMLKGM